MIAAEALKSGWLVGVDEKGLAWHMRSGEEIQGVCLIDCAKGQEVKLTRDFDAVLEALNRDTADRQ